ncbi:putative calcium-binding protein CML12 [Panicum miliaceum]|uniref:Calcium-binding protein CML12 n=1 Tax=Panicum miliaceum TaxID=4540 RepID=A0A3L6SNT5_PANMI|nr:putative calcium-binding protein CML12 [Panicum miliaceum]
MPAAGPRPKRSASMPFHGPGAAKGRDPSQAPAAGGRARLRDEQLRQLRELFLRFDLDRDGSLTMLELAALLRSLGLRPAAGDELHALIAAMESRRQRHRGARLADAFRAFDRDGNGFISAAELARSMARLGHPICYAELTDMMREADTDGDGVISFPEFTAIMAKSAVDFLGLAAL